MKKIIFSLIIFYFFSSSIIAQDIMRVKNVWKNTYLNLEKGVLESSTISMDWESAQWEFIKSTDGYYRIKNVWKGSFLNIENGSLSSSPIQNSWLSAKWIIKIVNGSNEVRISNVWKPTLYLNIERGLACTTIDYGWHSAKWKLETVRGGSQTNSRAATTQVNNNGSNNSLDTQKVLAAHNTLRREVGVPPLTWSTSLATKAQAWANKVAQKNMGNDWNLFHSGSGENIAGGFVKGDSPDKRVLLGWGAEEKVNFNPSTRKCYHGKVCGHYTQVIWRNTRKVGCGLAINPNGKYILVCNYDPPGNYNNQTPY